MKRLSPLMITLLLATSTAFAGNRMDCKIYKGVYVSRELVRTHTSESSPEEAMRYYGKDTFNGVNFVWGVNVGFSVPEESKHRFQIFAHDRFGEVLHIDVDSRKLVDVGAYLAPHQVSIQCTEQE